MVLEHLPWVEVKEEVSGEVVLELEEVAAEDEVAAETCAFSFRGDNVILVKVVNFLTRLPEQEVVEAVSEEAKQLGVRGFHHMVAKVVADTSNHKEAVAGMASLWVQVVVTLNKVVHLVTASRVVTEVKEGSQVLTVARADNRRVTVDSQVATEDSLIVTVVVAVTAKHRRVATLSRWQAVGIFLRLTRRPLDTDSRAVTHNREAAVLPTRHLRASIANNLEDFQGAEPMRHKEEVHLVAMEHHLEGEDVEGDIPSTKDFFSLLR